MDHLQVLESCLKADGVKCHRVSNPHLDFIETDWHEFFYHEGLYKLFEIGDEGESLFDSESAVDMAVYFQEYTDLWG